MLESCSLHNRLGKHTANHVKSVQTQIESRPSGDYYDSLAFTSKYQINFTAHPDGGTGVSSRILLSLLHHGEIDIMLVVLYVSQACMQETHFGPFCCGGRWRVLGVPEVLAVARYPCRGS